MDKEYSDCSIHGSRKGKDNINLYQKLINGSAEYQGSYAPIQMLSKEKAPLQASVHSLLPLVGEDVYEETSMGKRKNAKRRIIVSIGVLAVLLIAMLVALGFTLLFTSRLQKSGPSGPDRTIMEGRPLLGNTRDAHAQLNLIFSRQKGKDANLSDEEVAKWYIITAEQGNKDSQNKLGLMYFFEKPLNKEKQMRNINLDRCIGKGKVCLSQMKKLRSGMEKLQNKGI
uniref:Sel1 repeat family protein n=1 Tax=Plectus sambesii TaxID=2011161 RepID=A0A914UST9_9BILA